MMIMFPRPDFTHFTYSDPVEWNTVNNAQEDRGLDEYGSKYLWKLKVMRNKCIRVEIFVENSKLCATNVANELCGQAWRFFIEEAQIGWESSRKSAPWYFACTSAIAEMGAYLVLNLGTSEWTLWEETQGDDMGGHVMSGPGCVMTEHEVMIARLVWRHIIADWLWNDWEWGLEGIYVCSRPWASEASETP